MNEIFTGGFLNDLLNAALALLIALANIILYPFGLLIQTVFPAFDDALSNIADMFDLAAQYVGWAISLAGIPPVILTLLIGYYTFTITLGLATWSIKLALKWIDTFA